MPAQSEMLAYLLFAVVAAVTPGPSNVMLTTAGANAGIVRGLPCLFGVSTGMGLMMFLVPLGLGSLVLAHPLVLRALNWGGAAFLLWLAWKIATSRGIETESAGDPVGYLGATVFQWINPKSWLVSVSAAGTFLHPGSGSAVGQAALLGGLFVVAALPSGFLWLALGATAQRALRTPRRLKAFNLTMAGLLVLSVALALTVP
jgi:threonine/homoserine/homoserine lactone efflux protein